MDVDEMVLIEQHQEWCKVKEEADIEESNQFVDDSEDCKKDMIVRTLRRQAN